MKSSFTFQAYSLSHAVLEYVRCLIAKDGKDDRTGVDGGEGVTESDDDDIFDTVFGWVVVGAKTYDGSKSQAEGVENLKSSNKVYFWFVRR